MKKRVRINENAFRGLIEQTIRETLYPTRRNRRATSRREMVQRVAEGVMRKLNESVPLEQFKNNPPFFGENEYPKEILEMVQGLSYDEVIKLANKNWEEAAYYEKAIKDFDDYFNSTSDEPDMGDSSERAYYVNEMYTLHDLATTLYEYATFVMKKKGFGESIVRNITENVMRKLREGVEEDEGFDTPHVSCLEEICDYIKPERALSELNAFLNTDEIEEVIDKIFTDYDLDYHGFNRQNYHSLEDFIDLLKPEEIMSNVDGCFGLWDTEKWANRIVDVLWNNEPQSIQVRV